MNKRSLAVSLSRQRRIPYRIRRSLLKRLAPAMLKDFSFEAPMEGGLRFRGNIVNYIDRLVYFCGAHEKYMLRFLRDYVRSLPSGEGVSFLDIGANAGNHTLFMARLVGEVHAFEPYPRVRAQLEENIALNHLGNVKVYPFGLSDRDAVMPFYAGPENNLGAASFVAGHKSDNAYLGDMQLKRGDDVTREAGIRAAIIKADVEGFEKFVLEGLRDTMASDRPLVIVELSPTTRESLGSAAAFYVLFPPDYRFYYFAKGNYDTGAYKLAPFDYALSPRIQDVIAWPGENAPLLG